LLVLASLDRLDGPLAHISLLLPGPSQNFDIFVYVVAILGPAAKLESPLYY
jgi:hypothetical protein